MPLTSASTLAEIRAAYADNASYEEDSSPAKARGFITACRLLLLNLPKRAVHGGRGGEEIELDLTLISAEMIEAKKWLAVFGSALAAARATYVDFRDFRS
jgi:hypothetical protein